MNYNNVKHLNNKELNNRLTHIILPKLVTQTIQFTNDFELIKHHIFPILKRKRSLNSILIEMANLNFDIEEFNMIFCRYVLIDLIEDDE